MESKKPPSLGTPNKGEHRGFMEEQLDRHQWDIPDTAQNQMRLAGNHPFSLMILPANQTSTYIYILVGGFNHLEKYYIVNHILWKLKYD